MKEKLTKLVPVVITWECNAIVLPTMLPEASQTWRGEGITLDHCHRQVAG